MRVPLGWACVNKELAEGGAPESHTAFSSSEPRGGEVSQRGAEDINLDRDRQPNRHPAARVAARNSGFRALAWYLSGVRVSIGQLLIAQGAIDAGALSDALARQSGRHPLASELYVLGYASERALATALSVQTGWPAIVLDESTIRLDLLEQVSIEWARIFSARVVYEGARSLVVAAARPEDAIVPARELGAARGKNVELRIALDVTLARAIRIGFKKWKFGETYLVGPESEQRTKGAYLAIVQPDSSAGDAHRQAQRALAEEASRNIEDDDELPDHPSRSPLTGDWQVNTITT